MLYATPTTAWYVADADDPTDLPLTPSDINRCRIAFREGKAGAVLAISILFGEGHQSQNLVERAQEAYFAVCADNAQAKPKICQLVWLNSNASRHIDVVMLGRLLFVSVLTHELPTHGSTRVLTLIEAFLERAHANSSDSTAKSLLAGLISSVREDSSASYASGTEALQALSSAAMAQDDQGSLRQALRLVAERRSVLTTFHTCCLHTADQTATGAARDWIAEVTLLASLLHARALVSVAIAHAEEARTAEIAQGEQAARWRRQDVQQQRRNEMVASLGLALVFPSIWLAYWGTDLVPGPDFGNRYLLFYLGLAVCTVMGLVVGIVLARIVGK